MTGDLVIQEATARLALDGTVNAALQYLQGLFASATTSGRSSA
jgi:hypothetical protein